MEMDSGKFSHIKVIYLIELIITSRGSRSRFLKLRSRTHLIFLTRRAGAGTVPNLAGSLEHLKHPLHHLCVLQLPEPERRVALDQTGVSLAGYLGY